MLGVSIYSTIVDDYPALQEAYAEGRLVDESSYLGKSISRLTAKVAGVEPKKKKFSLFG